MSRRPGAYAGVNGAIAPKNWPWIGLLFSRRSRSLHSDDSAQPSRHATDITMMAIPLQIKPRWRLRSERCLRVQQAQCLRQFWHARSDVFRTVGVALGEAEAELRLAQLNRHFQTRSPRSKWAPL